MRILLFGRAGQVGWELRRSLAPLGDVVALDAADVDFCDPDRVGRVALDSGAAAIVNAAAYTAVDRAESDESVARRVNAEAVAALAHAARQLGAWLVHYSTDYVYDGSGSRPWLETDPASPISAYGRTKLEGDRAIERSGCMHLVFRTSWVYAARGQNFVRTILRLAAERDELRVVGDQHGVPTSAEFLADVSAMCLASVLRDPSLATASGVYHLAPRGETTWHGVACAAVEQAAACGAALKATPDRIVRVGTDEFPRPARRPANSRLCVDKVESRFGVRCPEWRLHLARTVAKLAKGPDA